MGNSSNKNYDREITNKIKETHYQNEAIHGLLLLGAGEAGKSTFMRQMRHLWGQQYSDYDRQKYRNILWGNLIESMQILCRQHQKMNGLELKKDCILDEEKNSDAIQYILKMDSKTVFDRKIKDIFQFVWEDVCTIYTHPTHTHTYTYTNNRLEYNQHFLIKINITCMSTFTPTHPPIIHINSMDSAEYFFDNMNNYIGEDFIPTFTDLCHCRIRTLGITQEQFDFENTTFRIYDVGGQRSERRKWLHTFDNCKAILFVTSLIGYIQVTFEDESTNRMHESFAVYDKYLNHSAFENMNIILFLNKNDLYKKMIADYPFYTFPENNPSLPPLLTVSEPLLDTNNNNSGSYHSKYHSSNSSQAFTTAITMAKIEEYTGDRTSNEQVIEYIIDTFKSLTTGLERKSRKRLLFHHLTCATDTESVQSVFLDVRHIVMQTHLKDASLYS